MNLLPPQRRYIWTPIQQDLLRKMVFVGGPRQVGKTTLALSFLETQPKNEEHSGYLNWDKREHRTLLLRHEIPDDQRLIILDEIHKYAKWRGLVKGLYDTRKSKQRFLVTGSARLDYYRKGGDSLQGRYHYYRLHPFSLQELDSSGHASALEVLLRYGGFPEPLLAGNDRDHRRWLKEQTERILHDDLRDLERVREVSLIELLLEHLPRCVGSPLSIKSLSELLQVNHESVNRWISILERLYVCFRISPYGSAKIRAVKKEQKLYFWDWSRVPEGGFRIENLVASHLLKYCHWLEDTEGYRMELRFLRDTDKREVDFVVLRDGKPEFAVECKSGEENISSSMAYFVQRTPIPAFYQVHFGKRRSRHAPTGIHVLPFSEFVKERAIP